MMQLEDWNAPPTLDPINLSLPIDDSTSLKGIVYGKIAKKFYFLFEVLRLYRIKICIKIYMVSLGITP